MTCRRCKLLESLIRFWLDAIDTQEANGKVVSSRARTWAAKARKALS